jgi:rare lipoprotein A
MTLLATGAAAFSALASWFGPGLFGNSLACGGTLTPQTNGVAHKTLPCGTRLRVCYRRRCARTRVVDRGPFVAGREFDLTSGLATRLHFRGVHTIRWTRQ